MLAGLGVGNTDGDDGMLKAAAFAVQGARTATATAESNGACSPFGSLGERDREDGAEKVGFQGALREETSLSNEVGS